MPRVYQQTQRHDEFAFAAFISASTASYTRGAVVLARTLRRVTNLDMLLMVLEGRIPSRDRAALRHEGWMLCAVPVIANPPAADENRFTRARIYSKLAAWNLTEYEAVLLLDLDTLVLRDPSDAFTSVLPRMRARNQTLGASIDHPMPGGLCGSYWAPGHPTFNAGVLLIVPSTDAFERLRDGVSTVPHNTNAAEQSYLNVVYPEGAFYSLAFAYNGNAVSITCEPDLWRSTDIKIIHFTVQKPWEDARFDLVDRFGVRRYAALWQSVYDTEI